MGYYRQEPPKKAGFNFSDDASMGGILDSFQLGDKITKAGRVTRSIYKASNSGFRVYEIEDDKFRRFVVAGQFPLELEMDGYYEFTGVVKDGKRSRQDRKSVV